MAGKVKRLIDEIIRVRTMRSGGAASHFVKAHLMLNGIDPEAYTERSEDHTEKIALLEKMIRDFSAPR